MSDKNTVLRPSNVDWDNKQKRFYAYIVMQGVPQKVYFLNIGDGITGEGDAYCELNVNKDWEAILNKSGYVSTIKKPYNNVVSKYLDAHGYYYTTKEEYDAYAEELKKEGMPKQEDAETVKTDPLVRLVDIAQGWLNEKAREKINDQLFTLDEDDIEDERVFAYLKGLRDAYYIIYEAYKETIRE